MSTIAQIAKAAGVSSVTVSNVLNGRNQERWSSSKARADRIRKIAAEMGYRPNAAARAIRKGKFDSVALITASEGNTRSVISQKVLNAIHERLSEHDYAMTLSRMADKDLLDELSFPKLLRESHSDGLLVNYNKTVPEELYKLLQRFQIPSVWINAKMAADCVYLDDFAAGRLAAEQLLRAGHRRIGYFTATYPEPDVGESAHYSEPDRRDGAVSAVVSAGQSIDVLDRSKLGGADFDNQHMRLLRDYLARDDRPTAMVCYSSAAATLLALAGLQLGLDFPRQLSVVVIDQLARKHGFSFSTVVVNEPELGRTAVTLLFDKIQDPGRTLPPVAIPPVGFVSGQTCFPPHDSSSDVSA